LPCEKGTFREVEDHIGAVKGFENFLDMTKVFLLCFAVYENVVKIDDAELIEVLS